MSEVLQKSKRKNPTVYSLETNKLQSLLMSMDLPEYRKFKTTLQNLKWLHKNLHVKNSNNKNYTEAMELLDTILV